MTNAFYWPNLLVPLSFPSSTVFHSSSFFLRTTIVGLESVLWGWDGIVEPFLIIIIIYKTPRSPNIHAHLQSTVTVRSCSTAAHDHRTLVLNAQLQPTITERSCSTAVHDQSPNALAVLRPMINYRTLLLFCSPRSPNALALLQLTVTERSC